MLLIELRDYQVEARDKALPHSGFCLLGEMRTGKTPIALSLIDKRKPSKLLIVCPLNVVVVWQKALSTQLSITWDMDIEIINFEKIVSNKKAYLKKGREGCWSGNTLIICDESHRIKRRGSKASRLLRRLAPRFKWKLALSGTPISPKKISKGKRSFIVEGLQDLWAQFDFINPKIFGPYTEYVRDRWGGWVAKGGFEEKFCVKGGFKRKSIIAYKNKKLFNKLMGKYSHRITFDEANKGVMKSKRTKVLFSLSPGSRRIYNNLLTELETVVNGVKVSVPIMLAVTMKLQQITGGSLIHSDEETGERRIISIGTEKIDLLHKRLVKLKKPGEPWIIVARFKHEHQAITKLVRKLGLKIIAISGKSRYDPSKVEKADIILLQIASGAGIDLSVASRTVYYSWDYSYINQEQSKFRMVAYGKELIEYDFLVAKNTVDDLIYQATIKKKDLATLICDHFRKLSDGKIKPH